MTTLTKKSRADAVRQRRTSRQSSRTATKSTSQTARQSYQPRTLVVPSVPRPAAATSLHKMKGSVRSQTFQGLSRVNGMGTPISRTTRKNGRKGYDFAFSIGRTAVRAPTLSLPALGPRWISAGLTLLLALILYTMGTANTFKAAAAEVTGNQRLGSDEVNAVLGIIGQPIYKAVPSQIEKDLRTAFPDLANVSVRIGLPNRISISVSERTPLLAWYQDGNITWIDANGVAFMPRGDVQGLIQIASNGNPPKLPVDPKKPVSDQLFIEPDLVRAILSLSPQIPEGAPMVYDPKYGIGWQDPRGWSVYFGLNTQDIEMKKIIYQALLDSFSKQGIQPTLISVAYPDAPFYK